MRGFRNPYQQVTMRICFMNDNFYRSSGAAIAIRRISESMTGVDCFFAACTGENLEEDVSWMPAERFERFDLKTSNALTLFREIRRFKKWFRANGIDLAHCHHRRVASVLHVAGVPVLYTGQLVFPYEFWFRWLRPSKMTAITPTVAKNLLETTGVRVLACIGNPAPFPEAPPEIDLDRVSTRAVCIARLDPVKGHVHLLHAWKILHDRGFRYELDLIGEGKLQPELEKQAARDGISELVHFCGFTKDVSAAVRRGLFAVLVSEYEGQGIVTLEAAAMGRPSLLTAVPGSIDLIPEGALLPNGIPFGDPLALANALQEWFAHPEAIVQDGRLFFNTLKTGSDATLVAKHYRQIYMQILGNTLTG
jgi:glycosyltransferase involved in cell wall biosynthesis